MSTNKQINDQAKDILFREARTYSTWQDKVVEEEKIKALYDLLKYAPTSANCSPARFKFVQSSEAKERLKPHLAEGNVDKTMSAPVTVLIAHDMEFYEQLPKLFPHTDARSWFVGNEKMIEETAFRNGSLQGAYLIMAARAIGLDCGPMSGFDEDGVKNEFFAGENVEVNFICNLGYGDGENLHPRSPRFEFEDICTIL